MLTWAGLAAVAEHRLRPFDPVDLPYPKSWSAATLTPGEAVAEVLRSLPATTCFAGTFAIRAFGFQPFQSILNFAYAILAGVRPLSLVLFCCFFVMVSRPFVMTGCVMVALPSL